MKKIITTMICISLMSFVNAQYTTFAEVISSGGGISTYGSSCADPGSLCNFGIIGE
nr:hypothetical protein [Bacteroidota bacterium]